MVRVNMRNVTSAAQQLKSQGSSVTRQLASVGTAMTRVPRSDNFEGAAQRSMSGYVQHVHVDATRTLTRNVEDMIREFDHLITAFKSGVDSSDSAIIDTDYLQSQKAKLSALRAELERGISKGNAGCSEASGLASVTRLRQTAPTEIEDAERKLSQTSQKLTSFNGMSPSSRMKDITVESARVGGNIRTSGGSKSGQVFMESLSYATGAIAIGGDERKKKRVALRKMKSTSHHKTKEKSDTLAKVSELIKNGRENIDRGMVTEKATWETVAAVKKSFNHTGYHKIVSLKSSKSGFKTFRQVRGEIKRTNIYKQIDRADDVLSGSALGSKLSRHLADKEFRFAGGKVVAKVPIVGSLIDGGLTYGERQKKYGKKAAAIDGTVHAGITGVSTAFGAAIGTAIPIPGVGTALGALAGAMVGNGLSKWYDSMAHKKTMALKGKGFVGKLLNAANPLG
ncbi:T7SS effector LXG polymorphic toxin [Furfurilactobacillus rossiae]|uniref:T7SS effector LXG polymorphic toxin n=2 Tax=Furfurilactobacillus rossiae TaxID=231049 RepID=UPI0003721F01|nr:T7SS effector LXG polymorphic toxin [Furfurilactobacillus rossiae]QFR65612.1 hypothetical protein LR814_00090 [Furfurilactobacillus rossiae]QFR68006.1 hypothetical protein LR814_13280 [Furfurilactobacillus rossiae]